MRNATIQMYVDSMESRYRNFRKHVESLSENASTAEITSILNLGDSTIASIDHGLKGGFLSKADTDHFKKRLDQVVDSTDYLLLLALFDGEIKIDEKDHGLTRNQVFHAAKNALIESGRKLETPVE